MVCVVLLLGGCSWGSEPQRPVLERPLATSALTDRPDVVLVLTDDQVKGTWDAMPTVRRQIIEKGTEVDNAVIPTSTCCPSRVSLLTGRHSHSSGVYDNVGDHGGWTAFVENGGEDETIAVALANEGYRTGYFGKYLNGWVVAPQDYVPPGWDEFMAIRDPSSPQTLGANALYDYELTGTQGTQSFGDDEQDFSTDVLARLASDFVRSTDAEQPLFLVYSTTSPHAPFTPAPRHEGTRDLEPLPAWFSNDVEGKPPWLAEEKPAKPLKTRRNLRDQKEALASVDEGVAEIIDALGPRASDTLFIVMSDNGLQLGSHRLRKKYVPYTRSTSVPMAVRYDGVIEPGTVTSSLVANVDVTATIAEAAGVRLPDIDGRSVLSEEREATVLEGMPNSGRPAYCGVRTEDMLFIHHSGGVFTELYDYRDDPWERRNLADDPAYAGVLAELSAKARQLCSPTPPDFDW